MHKLRIDIFLHAPVVLEFENEKDRESVWVQINREIRDNRPFTLNHQSGYQGLITINPAYVRTIEEVSE